METKMPIEGMQKIVEMSDKSDRTEIARELNTSKVTIWKYQKLLKLV